MKVILGTAHGSNVSGKCSPDKRLMENRGQEFKYPSLSVFRDPTFDIQSDNNMNVKPHTVEQDNNIIEVRPITLRYAAIIIDYRKKYIDEYYELLVMNLHKYSPRIDVKCKIEIDETDEEDIQNINAIEHVNILNSDLTEEELDILAVKGEEKTTMTNSIFQSLIDEQMNDLKYYKQFIDKITI